MTGYIILFLSVYCLFCWRIVFLRGLNILKMTQEEYEIVYHNKVDNSYYDLIDYGRVFELE